jgi:hypothetical protein
VQYRYTALVRGASAVFPRGFAWLIPVWYAAIAAALVLSRRAPAWYTLAALLGLLLAAISLAVVFATMRSSAFAADGQGIWLGLRGGPARRGGRRRRIRHLPWDQIDQVQIRSRTYGAQVDIMLRPAAHISHRPNALAEITRTILLLVIPIACVGCVPGLLSPRWSMPLYRIRLYDTEARELRQALAARAPGTVNVVVILRTRLGIYRPVAPRSPLIRP